LKKYTLFQEAQFLLHLVAARAFFSHSGTEITKDGFGVLARRGVLVMPGIVVANTPMRL
jgi:hypothetical protein